jgi:phosphoglycerol transferase MdoB-like AlkP superfamily enzyme
MPEIQHASTRQIRYNQPARVLNLQQWKKKMGKESDDKPHKPTDQLSDREALLRIVDLASTPGLSDEALLEMVKALEQIVDKAQRSPKPDDTDGA